MRKQIVVIGLGKFGAGLATTLQTFGYEVLAIEKNEELVKNISQQITHVTQADATSETILKNMGISNFDIGIVAIGEDIKSSVLVTILLKRLEVKHIIARASDELHGNILELIGADTVIYPEREMGARVAQAITLIHVSDYLSIAPTYGIVKLKAPDEMIKKTLAELDLGPRSKKQVALLVLQRGKEILINPGTKEMVQPDDVLILAGNHENIEQFLFDLNSNGKKDKDG